MARFSAIENEQPLSLRASLTEALKSAEEYEPAKGLEAAMDVAMLLGEPLLLTGDPGVGKTRAAYWLANELKCGDLLRFNVKSSTSGTDLLYAFDEVGRFRDGARPTERPLVRYLRLHPLGEAILRAAGGKVALQTSSGETLKGDALKRHAELLTAAFGAEAAPTSGEAKTCLLLPQEPAFENADPAHRVVLIDEMDKAPRDTPNDLLSEIEDMSFAIPELGLRVSANPKFRPIVIITSNSEKSLPDPFLRRCAYFHIPFPGVEELKVILGKRLSALSGGGPLLNETLQLFRQLRAADSGVRKLPGTAELLAWLGILNSKLELRSESSLKEAARKDLNAVTESLTAVLKNKEDADVGLRILKRWTASID